MQLHLFSLLALLVLLISDHTFCLYSGSGSGKGGGAFFTCVFKHTTGKVTCGQISCDVVTDTFFHGKVLPSGVYRISPRDDTRSVTWYNLYPLSRGRYWDFNSEVPGLSCEGGYALHGGDYVLGTITVIDDTCMEEISILLDVQSTNVFGARTCKTCPLVPDCWWKTCSCGEAEIPRGYIAILYVYK